MLSVSLKPVVVKEWMLPLGVKILLYVNYYYILMFQIQRLIPDKGTLESRWNHTLHKVCLGNIYWQLTKTSVRPSENTHAGHVVDSDILLRLKNIWFSCNSSNVAKGKDWRKSPATVWLWHVQTASYQKHLVHMFRKTIVLEEWHSVSISWSGCIVQLWSCDERGSRGTWNVLELTQLSPPAWLFCHWPLA